MSDARPDPDRLLHRLQREEHRDRKGRLKIFFGAAPGVGKTYTMLDAARLKRAAGLEVVIGWVETHGRAETEAIAAGLDRLLPREIEYRGMRLREFDLDAALASRPALLLLDELAHSNAPGSRHAKRWQDAQELLEAGIDVWTTLNVQHLESVNDLVERIAGIVVRETLPDQVLDQADEVEFVDLPPEDLLRRLAEGKVYLPEQAERAVRQFFRKGNLAALRELALRRTAEHVDAALRDYRRDHAINVTWPVAERLLVCIRPNPESGRLVRGARRLAARLRAEWIVTWVETPGQPALSAQERQHLVAAFALAEQLGAETVTLAGTTVSEAVLRCALERNISKVVVGKPAHPRWRDRLRGSLVDDIVRASGDIDVFIISGETEAAPARSRPDLGRPKASGYLFATAVVAAVTLVCLAMLGRFDNSNLIMLYLLGVAVVATRHGKGPSVLAVCLSVAAFDFFLVPPHLTFAVSDTQYVVTFGVMLVVGLLVSTLAARVRDAAEFAREREKRTKALYSLGRELAGLRDVQEIAQAGARHVAELYQGHGAVYLPDPSGLLAPVGDAPVLFFSDNKDRAVAQWSFDHARRAGAGTDTLPAATAIHEPLPGSHQTLGVLAVQPHPSLVPLTPEQSELLTALARQIAAPLERARMAADAERERLSAESERLRNTLLSSVSHDLRTPLAAITGAASSLLEEPTPSTSAGRELAATILDEADRLNRLVGNLLDMTRIESGTLSPKREWHSLEEVVGSALARVERYATGRRVVARLDPDIPLALMDGVLIEQTLVNLLENALRHGPGDGEVRVAVRREPSQILVEVSDDGPGFPSGAEERLFDKFYRAAGGSGAGLGLAIARAIVTAHGGRIWAEAGQPHGAVFRFTLPTGEAPPSPPEESA